MLEFADVPLVEFMYLVFTCMPGYSYRQLRSLLLYLYYVFRVLISSLVREREIPGLILFQIYEKSSWYQSCISHHIRLPVYEVYLMKMNVLIKASIKIIQPTITLFCSHHDLNPITPIVPGTRASPPGLSWHRSGPSVACPVLSSLLHPDPLPQQQSNKLQFRTKDKRDVRGPVDNKPQCFVFQICVSPGSTSGVDGGSI